MGETFLEKMKFYAGLGYEITLTHLFSHEGIKMTRKSYSYHHGSVSSEQIIKYSDLSDDNKINEILNFLYEDIQEKCKKLELIVENISNLEYVLKQNEFTCEGKNEENTKIIYIKGETQVHIILNENYVQVFRENFGNKISENPYLNFELYSRKIKNYDFEKILQIHTELNNFNEKL